MKYRKLVFTVLLSATMLMFSSCNEENLTNDVNVTKSSEEILPAPCKSALVEENGVLVEQNYAPTQEELMAAEMTKADQKYIIPVVFHVFGKNQGSGVLNTARIEKVLKWINNDYHNVVNAGDPQTFKSIFESRKPFISTLNVEFKLARYDEEGLPIKKGQKYHKDGKADSDGAAVLMYSTSHPANKAGLGNGNNTLMSKISWDNTKYYNIYITKILYADGDIYQSGVSWLPDSRMTKAGTSRTVYNGWFLPGGSYFNKDFTSIISHECGHWLGLKHPFQGGCLVGRADSDKEGDRIADTPQAFSPSKNASYAYHGAKNCNGVVVDYGNYMNYGVYCDWTKGQVVKMTAALNHPARKTLWTAENVEATIGEGDIVDPNAVIDFDTRVKNLDDAISK
ncbi:MAG: hypothetical protein IMY73_04015 [Bacteroidetes bacterium]|nr:hypothetical protein [Bacteroidota bacterium]